MKVHYDGMGAFGATFHASGVEEGAVVRLDESGAAVLCSAGEQFVGVCTIVREQLCHILMGGLIRVRCSGTIPGIGFAYLRADGAGGVCAGVGGREHLIVAQNDDGTIVIKL